MRSNGRFLIPALKTLRLLCSGWLLLAVGGARAQVPPARQEAELQTRSDQTAYGKLVYQDDYPAEWYDTDAYYPRGSRQGVLT